MATGASDGGAGCYRLAPLLIAILFFGLFGSRRKTSPTLFLGLALAPPIIAGVGELQFLNEELRRSLSAVEAKYTPASASQRSTHRWSIGRSSAR